MNNWFLSQLKKSFSFIALKILFIQTAIILFIIYFLILGPIAVLAKITSRDFLKSKLVKTSFWQDKKIIKGTLEEAKQLY